MEKLTFIEMNHFYIHGETAPLTPGVKLANE